MKRFLACYSVMLMTTACDQMTASGQMNQIEAQVATDVENQYRIAKSSGTAIDACVHAGIVAAAYLQAEDQAKYTAWKATEKADCAAAGLPR